MKVNLSRTMKAKFIWVDWAILVFMVSLALVPVINVLFILATTGANNLSNDYAFFLPLINNILSGGYDWGHFFKDTFFISHFQPLPILVYLVNALLTGWNIYYELFFVAILSIIRVVLTYRALTILCPKRFQILLMPVLAMLVFSISQISSYEFGASSVPLGFTAFGFTLAVWGLVRYIRSHTGIIIMALGGLIASWTAATGLIAWPIFLMGMLLLGYKKLTHYISWLVTAIIINYPYLYFLVIEKQPGANAYPQSFFNPRLISNLLGRPFANGIGSTTGYIPLGEAAGWLGVAFGAVGVMLVFGRRKKLRSPAAPALMFMALGTLSAWQTSIFRVMIAPWYTNMVMPFWIGLAGIVYVLIASKNQIDLEAPPDLRIRKTVHWVYCSAVMIGIVSLYIHTNLTYQDKSFYLSSRSPVSAACLRNYEWAPTYCERYVFQWAVNRVYLQDFAWPLQNHQLSVFSPHQHWSMQGDVVLGRVYSPDTPNALGVQWVDGFPKVLPVSYTDHKHLSLLVSPESSVNWTVDLPENMQSAELISAIGIGEMLDHERRGGAFRYEIYISTPNQIEQLVYSQPVELSDRGWEKISISLSSYHGQEITLRFAVNGEYPGLASLFRYPFIDLQLQSEQSPEMRPTVRPINTELSPSAPLPQSDDYVINLAAAQLNGLTLLDSSKTIWVAQTDPYIYTLFEEPLTLSDYGWISFRMSASTDILTRAAEVFLFLDEQDQPVYIVIPLLADGGMHTYSFPLRMLEATGKLVAFRLDPIMVPSLKGENIVTVEDIRLIRLP